MNTKLETTFVDLANDAIEEAEDEECSFEEFVEGLHIMYSVLYVRYNSALAELKAMRQ